MPGWVRIEGAREHNLQNLDLEVPLGRLVVVTGVSGSGKSTLAFDLLFAEGQRRFLDSMGTYARQFVEQLHRPEVDRITGLPPTVSIEQRTSRGGGKSTVATVTEVFHFLRLLYARLGVQYCPECDRPVIPQTRQAVVQRLRREAAARGELTLLAPVVRGRKGFHSEVAHWAARHGYQQLRADGRLYAVDEPFRLDRFREHDVEIVTGRLPAPGRGRRPTVWRAAAGQPAWQLVEETLAVGHGTLFAMDRQGRISIHSTERCCPECGRSFPPLDPKFFSYNSAAGWCPRCRGFGELFYLPEGVDRGARGEAIEESWFAWAEGERETCPDCQGSRLNPVARAVRLVWPGRKDGPRIEEISAMSVREAGRYFERLQPRGRATLIARDILPEIRERLRFLEEVGLDYLQLGRGVTTLSGGEAQRIRLAAQLGSNLSGVLYILDEPTIGLHPRDNARLLTALEKLRDRGNTVLVVEHDEETIRRADHLIDLGPGAGVHGGRVVAQGTLEDIMATPESRTGSWLRRPPRHPLRGTRRPVPPPPGKRASPSRRAVPAGFAGWLVLEGAAVHNLKNLTVPIPLGRLVVISGVSGSGKSTLVRECLLPALQRTMGRGRSSRPHAGAAHVSGYESLAAVHEVDQSPIGRTPRSIPATYTGVFDEIRRLFAGTPEARLRGFGPGRFSFNSREGRCPGCEGAGVVKLEMNFLPPALVPCELCGGRRFGTETLEIRYHDRNVAEVLEMSVAEAREFFGAVPKVRRVLDALHDTGLDYLKLGQPSPTLSGGEAQRVKLVTHLLSGWTPSGRPRTRTRHRLFVLEEPTIGLHGADVHLLIEVLHRLVDAGHTVLVIEHHLDLIAEADWVIDLGPESGERGGRIVVAGTPEQVARHPRSHTGRWLRSVLARLASP